MIRAILANHVSWSPKYIEIIAFALTFVGVVLAVHIVAKLLTGIMDFAFLGFFNKLAGLLYSKTILLLSIVINLFRKLI
jgi:membrane protein required for colicin V production